jgi:TetR/AcrR family transcriptional repressor of nem operon
MIAIIQLLMGYSQADKAKHHERIVEIAAARIRESGTAAPGVAEIMGEAGLTHGGFYKHFGSRDDLVAEAVDRTFADGARAIAAITDAAEDPLGALVDWYASAEHRDDPATGCGIVALGADVLRGEDRVRSAYREQVERYLGQLQRLLGGGGDDGGDGDADARARATVALSTLVGALLMARAVDDLALSDEILRNARDAVKSQHAGPHSPGRRDDPEPSDTLELGGVSGSDGEPVRECGRGDP